MKSVFSALCAVLVIADKVTTELLTHKLVATIVSPKDIMRASAANDKYNQPLPIAELGKLVDAEVVIYIEMESFGLTNDGQTANPVATCSIRVINSVENKRLFPIDKAADYVSATLRRVNPHRVTSDSEVRKLAAELAVELGDSIAKGFYDHNIGRLGENLNRK